MDRKMINHQSDSLYYLIEVIYQIYKWINSQDLHLMASSQYESTLWDHWIEQSEYNVN
jgi:hypothetical protein